MTNNFFELSGKTALVTGGAMGMGRACELIGLDDDNEEQAQGSGVMRLWPVPGCSRWRERCHPE